ncbi:MAG: glycosyltransferase [Oscillospiraceae bacterium]|nr:glycosyltransferase [Oscillospiraceae bacterium]
MKLLSVAVPCYNSQDYMCHCVETLLTGGQAVEILIVDDGSTDETGAIADRLEREHPGVVRAVHQANAGHGGAVMAGLAQAQGLYFKVVDSDDWVDPQALAEILQKLEQFGRMERPVDVLVSNYIYDKVGVTHKKAIRYEGALPVGQVLTWDQVGVFRKGQYLLMHALMYRTQLLRQCGLDLPRHTFYVDNLYAYTPLASVRTLYYMDVDLYHYFIGREGQSVQEEVMISRIDQQLQVNRLMLEQVDLPRVSHKGQQRYLLNYLEIVTAISSILLIRSGTPEALEKKQALWQHIQDHYPWVYRRLRRRIIGVSMNLPGRVGRGVSSSIYRICRRIFGFN